MIALHAGVRQPKPVAGSFACGGLRHRQVRSRFRSHAKHVSTVNATASCACMRTDGKRRGVDESKISSANCPPSSFGIVVPVAAGERGVLVVEAVRRLSGWLWVRCAANGVSILFAAFAAGGRSAPRVSDRTARGDGSANSKRGNGQLDAQETCRDCEARASAGETEAGAGQGRSA